MTILKEKIQKLSEVLNKTDKNMLVRVSWPAKELTNLEQTKFQRLVDRLYEIGEVVSVLPLIKADDKLSAIIHMTGPKLIELKKDDYKWVGIPDLHIKVVYEMS